MRDFDYLRGFLGKFLTNFLSEKTLDSLIEIIH